MKTKSTSFTNINLKSVLIFIVLLVLSLNLRAQYCAASGDCYMYINRVQFSNIDNWSSCSNYEDFTSSFSANVEQGYSYQIAISNPNHFTYNYCDVWIDWNKDSIFDNNTEYYSLLNTASPYTGTISVPVTAQLGETRMRIRLRYEGNIDPCGNASQYYGEVEDYTINVVASTQMTVESILFNQFNGITIAGAPNVKVAGIKVVTKGGLNPLYVKSLHLNTLGSFPNINGSLLSYTNNSPIYSTQIGIENYSSGNELLFSDSIRLFTDTNYFWLSYYVSNGAPLGSHLKANLDSLNINDSIYLSHINRYNWLHRCCRSIKWDVCDKYSG